MFLSREIDIKLFQNYTKSYIYQISYKIRTIKQTIFNKYATNLKYRCHVIHVTSILLCYWRKFWWRNTRLYKLSIVFGIVLTKFYINFSRQEHQIDVLYVSFKAWDSQVSAYTPFHFSFTVPLRFKSFALSRLLS